MNEIVTVGKNNEIIVAQDYMEKYLILKDAVKQFKEVEDQLKAALLDKMLEYEIKRVETDNFVIKLNEASSSIQLDNKKVMSAFEEFGIDPRPYQKEVLRSAYVKIEGR